MGTVNIRFVEEVRKNPQPSMASSDSNRNNGDQLEEEEEEYEEIEEEEEEYEEIEEEVEVEEEEEPEEEEDPEEEEEPEEEEFEEVEEDEEEFEVEEVADEGKHGVEEVEEGVKDEIQEGKQEVVGEAVGDEEDVEEEYEDVEEEEEYEDVEEEEEYEEVEVTDEEDATMGDAEFDDNDAGEINRAAKSLPVPFSSDTMCKDASQDVESEGNEVCLRSGDTSAINTEADIVHDDAYAAEVLCPVEGSSSPAQMNDDGNAISTVAVGISESPKLYEHVTGPLDNGSDSMEDKQGHVKQTVMVSASEKNTSAPEAANDQFGKLDLTDVDECKLLSKEADLHFPSKQSIDQTKSRVRPRSSSPVSECQDGNKRAAIICEFFARGWCIKGSSCRFLHKREHVDNATQVGDALPAEIELQSGKGSGDDAYASGSTCGKDILMEQGESLKFSKYEDKDKIALLDKTVSSTFVSPHSQKSSSLKDGSRTLSGPRVEAEVFKGNHVFDNHDLSISEAGSSLRQNFFPRCGFSTRELGVASSSDSLLRLVEESAAMRRRYSLDFQSSAPPYHFSSWKSTSLLHNSSLLSGSDPATISGKSYAKDQPISFNYKTTFTPYNWEPSVPFRSSYFIPPVKRSSDIQYDPFRDSIEQPNVEHASFKNSSYGNTQDVQSISGRNSLELHNVLRSDSWGKNYSTHDKVIPEVEAESAATSASDVQNKKIVEEENPMVPGSVKDILKASRSINDGSSKMSDLLRNGEMKVNGRQPNELDDEESKAIKYFRAALIEFVKELMKPIWHEGRLSKDVYKVIVQKAEDKILSTLQPEQVPSSSESIKQYLSSSRPKIMKLIQAYVDKYGKF